MTPDLRNDTWFRRLLPSTLRSRLTLIILVTNLVVLASAVLILVASWFAQQPILVEETARQMLGEATCRLDVEAEHVDSIAIAFAEYAHTGIHDHGRSEHGRAAESLGLFEGYGRRMGVEAAAWIQEDGSVLHGFGDAADVSSLRQLTESLGSEGERGLLGLSEDRLSVVSVRPITGEDGARSAGWYAAAIEIPPSLLTSEGDAVFVKGGRPVWSQERLREVSTAHDGAVLVGTAPKTVIVRAEMLGVDNGPVGWLEMRGPSPVDDTLFSLLGLSVWVAGGLAIVSGLVVGVALTNAFRRPLDALIDHAKRDGHAALEGQPLRPVERDPLLPDEFHSLLDVYDRLLAHLARRQTELLAAQEEAAAAVRSLGFAVNDSAEAKVLIQDEVVVLANPAAVALLGVPAERITGSVDDVFDDVGLTTERGERISLEEAVTAATERPLCLRVTRPNGSERWAEIRVVAHENDSRVMLVTGRDITEGRRVEALRAEVVSLVSHDLRAPLTVISGYLDMLERQTDTASREKIIAAARGSASRMSALLEDLLSATRAEELFTPSRLEPVSMSVLAEEVVSSLEHTSGHAIQAHALCEGMVIGEERRLRQVLVNLIANAIKHTPDDGRIDVTVDCRENRVVTLVEDEGPGIPEEDREHVFERFTRLRREGLESPGVGLGLYIVRAIVEEHGGSVRVRDRGDVPGARVVVELPEADES